MASPNIPIKIDRDSGGNLRARIDKSQGLNKKERLELVDLLRKNMLYQTPRPVFADASDEHPTHVDLRFVFPHQQRILQLLHKAGGWTLPKSEQENILRKHEEAARVAYGDGVDYDLSHLSYGDMLNMYRELEGVEELAPFRDAIKDALEHQGEADGN